MMNSPLLELSYEDFLSMEEALTSTARGRAFLRMRDRQTRLVGIDDWRRLADRVGAQVERLEGAAAPQPLPARSPEAYDASLSILRQELTEMRGYIQHTRSEIAALRAGDAGSNRIMAATGELDAIVTATERATTEILNAAERIQEIAGKTAGIDGARDHAREIEMQVMEIMTACSFQDITGQRTSKVVNTLRYIEQRVNTMIEIWGVSGPGGSLETTSHRKLDDDRPDAHLLNGPALAGGMDQASIDAMMFSRSPATPAPSSAPSPAFAPVGAPAPRIELAEAAKHASIPLTQSAAPHVSAPRLRQEGSPACTPENGHLVIDQSAIDKLFD